jgi:DNA ligase-1
LGVACRQGKLRIGLGAETVLVALAHAQMLHRHGGSNDGGGLANRLEVATQAVKQAYSQCPSYDALIPALLKYPIEVGSAPFVMRCCRALAPLSVM